MDFAADVLSVWSPLPSYDPNPPPCTLYTCIQGRGGGGRVEFERRLEGQQFHKAGSKKYQHDWLYLESINSDKHLPQSPFTDQYF